MKFPELGLLLSAAAWVLLGPVPAGTGALKAAERQAVEVGAVKWERDFQGALNKSRKSGKPVLLLFQEVPGCSGCRKFGREVLSHPGLVAAIESEFIPLLVYNNRPGKDAEILQRYGEPAWNYQVIRFLDGSGKDIIPRRDRIWTIKGVARRMTITLETLKRPIPPPLQALTGVSP